MFYTSLKLGHRRTKVLRDTENLPLMCVDVRGISTIS